MKTNNNQLIKKYITIAILVALAVVLSLFDRYISTAILSMFPTVAVVFPYFKIGLANIVIMIIIYNYEFKSSFLAIILKSCILGLFALSGFVTFIIGFTGTILSYFSMYFLRKLSKSNKFMIFVSLVGGFMHSFGQICASLLFYGNFTISAILIYSPLVLLIGVVSGTLVGLITSKLNNLIKKNNLLNIKEKNMEVIYVGHRGGRMYGSVENTREAFISGAKAGCLALECDVRITKDDVVVISHDPDLKRLTENGDNPTDINVNNVTYEELKNIELTQINPSNIGKGYICLFEDYLKICKEYNVTPVIEFKWTNGIYASNEDRSNKDFSKLHLVIDLVKKYGLFDKAIFISFMIECILYLRETYPNIKLQQLTNIDATPYIDELAKRKVDLDILYTVCTKELVDKCHEKGVKVNIWTLNDKNLLEKYIEMGVDYITSDFISPKTK